MDQQKNRHNEIGDCAHEVGAKQVCPICGLCIRCCKCDEDLPTFMELIDRAGEEVR